MHSATLTLPPSIDRAAADAIAELTKLLQDGLSIDLDAFIAEHPECADRLRELVPTMQILVDLGYSAPCANGPAGAECATGSASADSCATGSASANAHTLGDFRIHREIGRGGMGVVYEAEQLSLGRRVALKVLPFAAMLDPRHLQRFKNEALAAAHLAHPHIVDVYGVGCERSIHFYAMRLIEGQTLAAVIDALSRSHAPRGNGSLAAPGHEPTNDIDSAQNDGDPSSHAAERPSTRSHAGRTNEDNVAGKLRVPPRHTECADHTDTVAAALSTLRTKRPRDFFRRAAELGILAAEALDHAHQMGIVHRDIKPSNLMIDQLGKLWITDFGLARFQNDPSMTITGDLIGTLRYMSPEQALAKRVVVDHRTDIYSLGVTLYELITHHLAFDGVDRHELLKQIAFEEPVSPRKHIAAISLDLETIVLKAMAKNPDERYATAQELADDLRRFVGQQPIKARPPSFAARTVKWVVKHRTAVATTFATLLLILAATAFVQWRARGEVEEALGEVRAKSEELQDAQRRTHQTLHLAREAVDDMYTEFANEWLSDQPQLTTKELEFLAKAVRVYKRLVEEFPADAELKVKAAAASIQETLRSANTHADSSKLLEELRKALALIDSVGNEVLNPELAYWRALARLWLVAMTEGDVSKGYKFSKEEVAEAFAAAEAAVKSMESIARQAPEDVETLEKLAQIHQNFAYVHRDATPSLQRAYARRSIETAERWLALKPDDEEALRSLAGSLLYAAKSEPGLARRAAEVAERAHRLRPSRDSRWLLAQVLYWGLAPITDGDEKAEVLHRAAELRERLLEDYPDVEPYYGQFFETCAALIRAQLNQGNTTAALQTNERCLRAAERQKARIPSESIKNYGGWWIRQFQLRAALMWILDNPEEADKSVEQAARTMGENIGTPMSEALPMQSRFIAMTLIDYAWAIAASDLRTKMMRGAVRYLERSLDDWTSHELLFLYHPDDKRAEAAQGEVQRLLRKFVAQQPERKYLISLAPAQVLGPFRHLSDDREALDLAKRADQLGSGPQTWLLYGWALYRLDRYAEALEWFEKLKGTGLFDESPHSAMGLSLVQMKLGRPEEAKSAYQHGLGTLRKRFVLKRTEISVLREAAAVMRDEKTVDELIRERWPGTE
jgi:serine/threonine protein kinase